MLWRLKSTRVGSRVRRDRYEVEALSTGELEEFCRSGGRVKRKRPTVVGTSVGSSRREYDGHVLCANCAQSYIDFTSELDSGRSSSGPDTILSES